MTVAPASTVTSKIILGVTHLLLPHSKPVSLLKCPFCDFRNIYENTITHHIRWTGDAAHTGMHINKLDKSSYVVAEKPKGSPYGQYFSRENLPLPWINCLWCDYRDKIAFDLSLHFLEEHKEELMAIPITRRERLASKVLFR